MGKGTQKRERSTETLFVGNSSNQSGQRKSNKKKRKRIIYRIWKLQIQQKRKQKQNSKFTFFAAFTSNGEKRKFNH